MKSTPTTLGQLLRFLFTFTTKLFSAIFIQDGVPQRLVQQYDDNLRWLREAEKHKMVVGSQARILYSDQLGRVKIALAFNKAVKNGEIKVEFIIHCDMSYTYVIILVLIKYLYFS